MTDMDGMKSFGITIKTEIFLGEKKIG